MYKKVLIATDGSVTASHAAEVGLDVAKASGAEVLLLHVGDPKDGKRVLSQAEKAHGKSGVTIKTQTVSGDPADMICEEAERDEVDLIVVGTSRRRRASPGDSRSPVAPHGSPTKARRRDARCER